jgi:pimeloyl-ACP methyl ester carboxylesterase
MGKGSGVILIHGGMEASQNYMKLGAALADDFTVYIPDRRGRGLSGPFGHDHSIVKDVQDITALMQQTGTESIFGLSSGAIIALRTALAAPAPLKLALYEPPISIAGSTPTAWVPQYDREIAQGRLAAALATALKGLRVEPLLFAAVPRFILVPLMRLGLRMMKFARRADAAGISDDVSIASLIPTLHYDMRVIAETADTPSDYRTLSSQVLLLGGSKSPAFLKSTLDALEKVLPHVRRLTFPGADHLAPTDDGQPGIVAAELRKFFGCEK